MKVSGTLRLTQKLEIALVGAIGLMLLGLACAEDTIFLKNGDALNGEIQSITDDSVTLTIRAEIGSSTGRIPYAKIDYIEFAPLPGEETAASAADLLRLWDEKQKNLHRPRSNAGEIGLAAAEQLLESTNKFDLQRAEGIFEFIEANDWNVENQTRAKQGRLRGMIALGQIQEAIREAKVMAEETEEPRVLIEANYVLASAEFDQLKSLEAENPRWELDDEVRPLRNEHLNAALDQFLFPYLFYGSEEEDSARGLLAAAKVHRFAKDLVNARRCLNDILLLYPDASYCKPAQEMISQISKTDSP